MCELVSRASSLPLPGERVWSTPHHEFVSTVPLFFRRVNHNDVLITPRVVAVLLVHVQVHCTRRKVQLEQCNCTKENVTLNPQTLKIMVSTLYYLPTADCAARTRDAKLTRPSLPCMRGWPARLCTSVLTVLVYYFFLSIMHFARAPT